MNETGFKSQVNFLLELVKSGKEHQIFAKFGNSGYSASTPARTLSINGLKS